MVLLGNADRVGNGVGHDLVKSTVHDLLLGSSLEGLDLLNGKVLSVSGGILDKVPHLELRKLLPLPEHSAELLMLQVLQPLEVADGNASSVGKEVGDNADLLLEKDCLAVGGGGTVGSLKEELSLDLVGVVDVDGLLNGAWCQDITGLVLGAVVVVGRGSLEVGD